MNPIVSVIVPSYNPGAKFTQCLASLDRLREVLEFQAVLVDDCSTDSTYARIVRFAGTRDWVTPHQLERNSGSPSKPRNIGLTLATGDYVIYLDADDQILPEGVIAALDVARRTNADFVRAPLIRVDGGGEQLMNTIDNWSAFRSRSEKAKAIVRFHSTIPTALFSRQFLLDHALTWSTDLHIAEDAVFLYQALAAGTVEYADVPLYIYDSTSVAGQTSATQRYENAEMRNHIIAWSECQRILATLGIDYFATRGQVALQAVIRNMIRYNRNGFDRDTFREFGNLLRSHPSVAQYTYNDRFAEIRDLILADRYEDFLEAIKARMVIAGPDLKFIIPALPALEQHYQVCIDEWLSHDEHDQLRSEKLLSWAEIIFCEWMLGNAVWYSERKKPEQRLVVRLHRFELTKEYGLDVETENVDRFVVIAPALVDELQITFGIPRTRIAYVPNFIPINDYDRGTDPSRVFNLAMVGFVPKLKGLHRALELLAELRKYDKRYTLSLYGKHPSEYPWVMSNPEEVAYFEYCNQIVRENNLIDAVHFGGWIDTKKVLSNVGFVLSLSDVEGSHVAATEGFASGAISLILHWPGALFLYPKNFIFRTLDEICCYILDKSDQQVYEREQKIGAEAMKRLYK